MGATHHKPRPDGGLHPPYESTVKCMYQFRPMSRITITRQPRSWFGVETNGTKRRLLVARMDGFSEMGLGSTSTPSMGVPLVQAEEFLSLSFSDFARYQPHHLRVVSIAWGSRETTQVGGRLNAPEPGRP